MRERNAFWILVLILIIATFLRLYQLERTPPGLYPDEAMNGNNALEALRTGEFKVYYPENNGREGLMMNIQALSIQFFGGIREPWVLRFPNALLGILTVWGVFLLGKELFSKRVGLLASFLMATSVWHIHFSRMSFRAIIAPLCITWALYLFLVALRKERWGERWILPALAGGTIFGLGFHSYIAYRILPLVFLVFLGRYWRDIRFWKVMGWFVAATFIAALPIGLYYLAHPADFFGRTTQVSIFTQPNPLKDLSVNVAKTVGMLFVQGDWNWRHNFAGRPQLFWPVALLFLWGIWLGYRALRHGRVEIVDQEGDGESLMAWESTKDLALSFTLLFVWILLSFLPVVVSSEGIPHALRSILFIPPVMVVAAAGGIGVWSYAKRRLQMPVALSIASVLFCGLLLFEAYQTYFILWASRPQVADSFNANYVAIGHALNRLPVGTPKYVVVEAGGVDVRGYPMPTQTTMFITDTFDPEMQRAKNIFYVTPEEAQALPPRAIKFYLK